MGMRRAGSLLIIVALFLIPAPGLRAQDATDLTTRLAALGRVWGLTKYFHPDVTGGRVDWDAALLTAIPRVSAAGNKASLNDELLRLMRAAGPEPRLPAGVSADQAETDPLFAWIDDRNLFEPSTIQVLKAIRRATVPLTSRYAKSAAGTGNPDFSGEAAWTGSQLPNEAERLLALFRFWNMVQYFFPNRDITDRAWSQVLTESIPGFIGARTEVSYHLAAAELIAKIDDTHGATSSRTLSSHWGQNLPPIRTRFIESQTVVTRVYPNYLGGADIRVGDVITDIDGTAIAELRARPARYLAASNEITRQRLIDATVFRTNAGSMTLGLTRSGVSRRVTVQTYGGGVMATEENTLLSQDPKWRVLPGNIGYANLSLVTDAEVPAMTAALRNTRAIVFDLRYYPNFILYLVQQWLNPAAKDFTLITGPDFRRPGSFQHVVTLQAGPAQPRQDYYRGRVLILIDERTQSRAEFTVMSLRTAPDAVVVGSQTAGADGNVSQIDLPGGIRTFYSGLGIFYPDGRPTQRVGIVPDVVVTPTISGIQNGIDEVLQRALALVQ
jgi:carboxyl-terminal processing protease